MASYSIDDRLPSPLYALLMIEKTLGVTWQLDKDCDWLWLFLLFLNDGSGYLILNIQSRTCLGYGLFKKTPPIFGLK